MCTKQSEIANKIAAKYGKLLVHCVCVLCVSFADVKVPKNPPAFPMALKESKVVEYNSCTKLDIF